MSKGVHFLDASGPAGMRLYAIGDVHGRLDLLRMMHAYIEDELEREPAEDWRIIHLGDYVDRGPDSKGVLDLLIGAVGGDQRIIALAGNHDLGFLDFLANPSPNGLFAHNGGAQTALSYGVRLNFSSLAEVAEGHAELCKAVPPSHIAFLNGLGFSAMFGDFFFCHAGIRPGVSLSRQDPGDLTWIRDEFLDHVELHPKVIVHGHTPSPDPEVLPNRINVDTHACRSGVLTALVIEDAQKRIVSVREEPAQ